ncbi:MAG: site-2 protease family protein [Acidilobus sp.]
MGTSAQQQDIVDQTISKYVEVADRAELGEGASRYKVVDVKGDLTSSFKGLYRELVRLGMAPALRRDNDGSLALILVKYSQKSNAALLASLAALTIVTVYISGLALAGLPGGGMLTPILYLVGLLGPLLIHESGHWIFMRRFDVPRSPPYLIPAPPLQLGFLGTLGAVINMKWVPATADELAMIGVAGPLAGFLAAIPVALVGLHTSAIVPASAVPPGSSLSVVPVIMDLLLAFIHTPSGYVVEMSPLTFAAYIVFFVTFLNLIPVGQLDGGHVLRAALGEKGHMAISLLFVAVLLVSGIYMPTLGLFGIIALFLLLLTRGRHPGPALEGSRLTGLGVMAVIIYGILLALTLPVPS